MAEIVNFNRQRKALLKAKDKERAAQNRVTFGRSKLQKDLDAAHDKLSRRKLDQLKLDHDKT